MHLLWGNVVEILERFKEWDEKVDIQMVLTGIKSKSVNVECVRTILLLN